MLQVNQLIGFGAGGRDKGREYTDFQSDTTDLTTYNFTSNIGSQESDRIIVVSVFGSRATGTPATITSVTINGVSATVQASVTNGASVNAHYTAVVPTGSTGVTITVVFGQQQNRAAIGVWALYGFSSATATDFSVDNSTPFEAAGFDVPANGVAIGSGSTEQGTTMSWTGLTEDFDAVVETNRTYTGASEFFTTAQTGLSSTMTPVSNSDGTGVWTAYA